MTKAELIASIGKEAKISKASAEKAVNAFIDTVTKELKKGDKLTLTGLGTFSVAKRKSRAGGKPQTARVIRGGKDNVFLHVAKPATAEEILRSLKISKPSKYAIHHELSHDR
jgi:DNA-binding protein HU-beta